MHILWKLRTDENNHNVRRYEEENTSFYEFKSKCTKNVQNIKKKEEDKAQYIQYEHILINCTCEWNKYGHTRKLKFLFPYSYNSCSKEKNCLRETFLRKLNPTWGLILHLYYEFFTSDTSFCVKSTILETTIKLCDKHFINISFDDSATSLSLGRLQWWFLQRGR